MIILIDILKFIVLVFVTFFSCQIVTDGKKRISYLGTLLICFSSAIIEYINSGLLEAIIFGEIVFIGLDNLFKNRYLFAITIPLRNFRIFIVF